MVVYRKYSQYHFLGDPLYYILWFYVGYRIEDIIKWLKEKKIWNFYCVFGMVTIVIALYAGNIVIQNKVIGAACRYILNPFLMTIAMNYFARKAKGGKIQQVCSSFGFGIYLYAEPLNYWVLYEINRQMGITFFGTENGAVIIWFLRIVITPIVAIGITDVLKKLDIKYLY